MSLAYQPYNLTLSSSSPVFNYVPYRDGSASLGWNSSYTDYTVNDALNNEAAVSVGYFRGIGAAYRTTSYAGATVSLNFTGTAIYLCFSTPNPLQYTFTLDGSQVKTTAPPTDPACAIYGSHTTILAISTDLEPGSHVATLTLTDGADGALDFYGATVTMNAGSPGPKTTRVISQADSGWDWQGDWTTAADDPYYWNGIIRYATKYNSGNIATYTFQNASAVILRGLSMSNYGPYTVTLDNVSATFNASDLYWRHSPAIIYFASGLNPNQSHTIQIMNFDFNYPNEQAIGPFGLLNTAVGTLELIVDDVETRDAVLSTVPSSSPSPSSNASPSTIAAAVLGALVFVLLGSSALFLILWQREKRKTRLATQTPEPWRDMDVASMSRGGTSITTGALLGSEPTTETSWRTTAPLAAVGYQPQKQGLRVATDTSRPMVSQRSPVPIGYSGIGSEAPLMAATSPVPIAPIPPPVPPTVAHPHVLSQLVGSLSTLLNGHLHAEYLQRERELDGMSDGPPGYRDE